MKCKNFSSDLTTPIAAFAAVAKKESCLLETAPEAGTGRRSFIGIDPVACLIHPGDADDPYEALRKMQNELGLPAVGFVAYDAVRLKENIPSRHCDLLGVPDLFFRFYRTYLTFDHLDGRMEVFAESDEEIDRIIEQIANGAKPAALRTMKPAKIKTDLSDAEFRCIVEQAKQQIVAGDIFQIVLSRTFEAATEEEPFQIYRALRQKNPAPYLFFLPFGDLTIVGASPEKLISVEKRMVESMPIAGTCGSDESIEKLLADPKEVAEHVMLVDLARNDLGAVCKPGTVCVKESMRLRSFSRVTHIVSRIVGELDSGFDALDAFKTSFPAGTLSGAPKVRAMEWIDALETSRRGFYGGAIVMLDGQGNLESCIAIRMAVMKNKTMFVRAGAGIVFDSDPQKEADETRMKANTVLDIIGGGL